MVSPAETIFVLLFLSRFPRLRSSIKNTEFCRHSHSFNTQQTSTTLKPINQTVNQDHHYFWSLIFFIQLFIFCFSESATLPHHTIADSLIWYLLAFKFEDFRIKNSADEMVFTVLDMTLTQKGLGNWVSIFSLAQHKVYHVDMMHAVVFMVWSDSE